MFSHGRGLEDIQDDNSASDPTDVILFMFFGLLLGVVTMQLLSRMGDPLPYTVVIFFEGIVFSFFNDYHNMEGMWGDSIYKWSRIDAELMLYVFLPPLIFGEAMNLNWFFVKNSFAQACILAGPGVMLTTAFMGMLTKAILPYNWSWYLSLTFGAVISASDTVAVLAIMKECGASPKLTMLIVGESLLNDGTAIVLFTLFFDLLLGQSYTGGKIILFFLNCCLGSPLFGCACGLIIVRWLRTVNRSLKEVDTIIQIAITICCAYLIFFLAQNPLQISGALACCGAGAMLAWLAPPLILNHESMHNIWSFIEWMGNTLIFLLAGLIIGTRTYQYVTWSDWGYMLLLYGVCIVVRFVVVAICYPILSRIGYQCSRREAVFMSWGCLRGALAMALALIVEKEGDKTAADQSSRFFFYVGGIATLTLLVNGTTSGKLLEKLGLMGEKSIEKDIIMTQMRKRLKRKMDNVMSELQQEGELKELGKENEEIIRQSCTLLRESEMGHHNSLRYGGGGGFGGGHGYPSMGSIASEQQSALLADIAAAHAMAQHGNNNNRQPSTSSSILFNSSSSGLHQNTIANTTKSSRSRASSFRDVSSPHHHQPHGNQRQQSQSSIFSPFSNFTGAGGGGGSGVAHVNSRRWDNRTLSVARVKHLSRGRPTNGAIMSEVLSYVRTIFLEIVRTNYWHDIETGKLPRLSFSARFLLYSIDVGLDSVQTGPMLQDWACIEYELERTPRSIQFLTYLERCLPMDTIVTRVLARLEGRREKRAVYMLTSFIDAHLRAQKKMHSYVGLNEDEDDEKDGADDADGNNNQDDGDDEHNKGHDSFSFREDSITSSVDGIDNSNNDNDSSKPQAYHKSTHHNSSNVNQRKRVGSLSLGSKKKTDKEKEKDQKKDKKKEKESNEEQFLPEELKVKAESVSLVDTAKRRLAAINTQTVNDIRVKQMSQMLLAKEAALVKQMLQEGLLSTKDAEEFLDEIGEDAAKIERDRNRQYWEGDVGLRRYEQRQLSTENYGFGTGKVGAGRMMGSAVVNDSPPSPPPQSPPSPPPSIKTPLLGKPSSKDSDEFTTI